LVVKEGWGGARESSISSELKKMPTFQRPTCVCKAPIPRAQLTTGPLRWWRDNSSQTALLPSSPTDRGYVPFGPDMGDYPSLPRSSLTLPIRGQLLCTPVRGMNAQATGQTLQIRKLSHVPVSPISVLTTVVLAHRLEAQLRPAS